ncbi:MAG: hypothetical protein ACYDDV_01940 [Methanoregula sp.]
MASVIIVRVSAMIRMAAVFAGNEEYFLWHPKAIRIFAQIFYEKIIFSNFDGG